MIEMNRKSFKNESQLIIPKAITRPMHRFFRNLNILRSMVRKWF